MKRLISFFTFSAILFVALTSSVFAVYEYERHIVEHEDGYRYVANEINITTSVPIDTEQYNEEINDFYGIKIKKIELDFIAYTLEGKYDLLMPGWDKMFPDKQNPDILLDPGCEILGYYYSIYTVEDYTPEEAETLFDGYDEFISYSIDPLAEVGDVPSEVIPGDANCNGEVDMMDYVLIKRAYFGTYELIAESSRISADINENGEIDMMDYILVKRMYFGTWSVGEDIVSTPDEA